ncbi:MAG: phosphate ABC transporter ATP-binding protein PstB [Oscillospiraceae bacterium]|nr:phosphate ABC transporter ATP-binding protein PstB [Oscillospiraceae bacterium]
MVLPYIKSKITTNKLNLYYGSVHVLKDITIKIPKCSITAIIGPSGCGKSSLLRMFNRTNDLIPHARVEGEAFIDGDSIYSLSTDVVSLRKRVGMVFQKPNVFPMSIYENVIIGPRHHGIKKKSDLQEICEHSLSQAALWDEVKDILGKPALALSAGAGQRLCIARALAVNPEVILFDESCSALDPESTLRIEDLMCRLAKRYTIIIVTHNMEQAARISDMSAFMMLSEGVAQLVEYASTKELFSSPKDKRCEDYIVGRFG